MVKVLGMGDNVCDVYLHTGMMYPGGQAANFAVYAAKLGACADYMGVFGNDAVARHVKATLASKNIGIGHCRSYEGENGFARVTLVEGDRVFKGSNKGGVLQSHPIHLDREDMEYVAGFDLIHTTNNGFTDVLLPILHQLPGLVSYDFSYRWQEEDRVARVCPYVDFAFLSCGDLNDEETKKLCRRLHDRGTGIVVATRGSKGATAYDGAHFYTQLPDLVEPVDTMGAGDSFSAALLVTILNSLKQSGAKRLQDEQFRQSELPKALKAAAAFSAGTCLEHGAYGCGTPVPASMYGRIYEAM